MNEDDDIHEAHIIPRVFLDTCILKHAIYERHRIQAVPKTVRWGSVDVTADVAEDVIENPSDEAHPNLKKEIRALEVLARRAGHKQLVLLGSFEQWWEYAGLGKKRGRFREISLFDDLPIETIEFPYGREILGGPRRRPRDLTLDFLKNLRDKRYREIADALPGARTEGKNQLNHLLDAFHLRLAEHGRADFFLTTDTRLINKVRQNKISKSLQVLSPIEFRHRLEGPTLWARLRGICSKNQ